MRTKGNTYLTNEQRVHRVIHPQHKTINDKTAWSDRLRNEMMGGPQPLPMDMVPVDLRPRRIQEFRRGPNGQLIPGGSLVEANMSPLDRYISQIAQDTHDLASTQVLQRGLLSRAITVTTAPTLLVDARFLRGYIFLNPAESTGLTTTSTLVASAARTAADNSATVGISSYVDQHFFLDVSAITAGTLEIIQQALDPVSGNWADVQTLFTATATGTTYAYTGATGSGANMRVRWTIAGGGTITFSVGQVLKQGLIGTTAGVSQTIYIGNAGVTTTSGFPLLDGQQQKFYLRENTKLYGVAGASLTMRIFEL